MLKNFILFIAILTAFTTLSAYPIPQQSLSKLLEGSDCVVVADVVRIEGVLTVDEQVELMMSGSKKEKKEAKDLKPTAILKVRQFLKGDLNNSELKVRFTPNMMCPAPARYKKSTSVVAFLKKGKDGKTYHTHGLSYGLKTCTEKGIQQYVKRIRDLQALAGSEETEIMLQREIGYYMECMKHPETRNEGLIALPSLCLRFEKAYKKLALNEFDQKLLREVLMNSSELSRKELALIDLINSKQDFELASFLLERVKKNRAEKPWQALSVAKSFSELMQRDDLKKIVTQYLDYSKKNFDEQRRAIIDQFLKILEEKKK